jgi:hypothetical protein
VNVIVQGLKPGQSVYIRRESLENIIQAVIDAVEQHEGTGQVRVVLEDRTTPNKDGMETWGFTVIYEQTENRLTGVL